MKSVHSPPLVSRHVSQGAPAADWTETSGSMAAATQASSPRPGLCQPLSLCRLTHRHTHRRGIIKKKLPTRLVVLRIHLVGSDAEDGLPGGPRLHSLSLLFCFQPRSLPPSLLPPPHMLTLTTDLAALVSPRRRQRQSSSAKRRR